MRFHFWKKLILLSFFISYPAIASLDCDPIELGKTGTAIAAIRQNNTRLDPSGLDGHFLTTASEISTRFARRFSFTTPQGKPASGRVVMAKNHLIFYFHEGPLDHFSKPGHAHKVVSFGNRVVLQNELVSRVVSLPLHPGKPLALAVGFHNQVWIYNVITGALIQRFTINGNVRSLILEPNLLAIGTQNEVLFFRPYQLLDTSTPQPVGIFEMGEPVSILKHHNARIGKIPDSMEIKIAGNDTDSIRLGELIQEKLLGTGLFQPQRTSVPIIMGASRNEFFSLAFTPDNTLTVFPSLHLSGKIESFITIEDPEITASLDAEDHRLGIFRLNPIGRTKIKIVKFHFKLPPPGRFSSPSSRISSRRRSFPSPQDYPHFSLLIYSPPSLDPTLGIPLSPSHTGPSSALLMANSKFSRGFIYPLEDGHLKDPMDSINEIGEIHAVIGAQRE